jgi:hypothetical protein
MTPAVDSIIVDVSLLKPPEIVCHRAPAGGSAADRPPNILQRIDGRNRYGDVMLDD